MPDPEAIKPLLRDLGQGPTAGRSLTRDEARSCLDLILAQDPGMHPDPVMMSCPLCDEMWHIFGKIIHLELYRDQIQKALDLPSHIAVRVTSTVSH